MIPREEIESKAQEFEVNPANLQRDYMFGWLLSGISRCSLKDQLILKGGNAFRKAYFENTRYSSDLDFGTDQAVDEAALRESLNGVCAYVHEATGVTFDTDKTLIKEKTVADKDMKVTEARVYFEDFYGSSEFVIKVCMDITEFDRMYLPVQTRNIIHPYSDRTDCTGEIRCQKLEELLANKLKCLLQRRNANDLYDFVHSVFINRDIDVQRSEIVTTLFKKTIYEGSPRIVKDLLIGLPFEIFKAAWSKYLFCPKQSLVVFEDAVDQFKGFMEELFGSLTQRQHVLAFCPSHVRNPIMEAGANQTKLELVYDGSTRIVEPYSLAYKRRADGQALEYFYGFDTSGGRSGHVGIKSFIASKVESIRDTGEKFEPRYPVELSKAGEASSDYFSRPFSGRSSPFGRATRPTRSYGTRVRSAHVGGPVYIFKCSYCNKQFRRKHMSDNRLNAHRNSYGSMCAGRIGFYVDTKY